GPLDELLDQRRAMATDDLACLPVQAGRRADARAPRKSDARIAAVMLDDQRKAQQVRRELDIGLAARKDVIRSVDALGPACQLHRLPRGPVEFRGGGGE